jgi:hypothetical protein
MLDVRSLAFLQLAAGNGIFAAGDLRAESASRHSHRPASNIGVGPRRERSCSPQFQADLQEMAAACPASTEQAVICRIGRHEPHVRSRDRLAGSGACAAPKVRPRSVAAPLQTSAAGNGIFAAGDRRAESALETISPRRDRKSETTTREKWPQKPPSCVQVLISRFRRTGWWAHQGSNLGPTD